MRKKCFQIVTAAAVLLLGLSLSTAGALDIDVRASDLVVSDDFDASFEAMPSDQVIEFLESFGINPMANRYEVTKQIDALRGEDPTNDDIWETAKDELNYYVNRVLFTAMREGYKPVYMTIGNTRWTLAPYIDE